VTPRLLAGVTLPFFGEIVALLVVSVVIAYLCFRVRLVPIAGFLLAGVVIGPTALGLVQDEALINGMAEIGVILLLFTIGVEFSLSNLARIGRFIFVGGGLQVAITTLVVVGALLAFGVEPGAGVFTGFLVALSSTAIVLSLLADRKETDTPAGRLSLAVLIFQDLAIIVMVLLVPMLSGEGGSTFDAILALGEAGLIIVVILVLARKAIPWLLEKVALTQRPELFLLAVVTICFGTAWLTSLAGVSLALGAFLAGLVVSESRYSAHALSEVLPLRTLFNAVFFVSVGMLLDLGFFVSNLPLVLTVAAGVLLLKTMTAATSVLVLGYPVRIAVAAGFALAQIGEFSFVLERAGREVGLTPAGMGDAGSQIFIAVTVLLMILTPFLLNAGTPIGVRLERTRLSRLARRGVPVEAPPPAPALEDHVLIIGYGPTGRRLTKVLQTTGIPFEIIELNPLLVAEAMKDNLPVLYGDAGRPHLLEHAGIRRAKLCVVSINDSSATRRIVALAHGLNPTLQIIVRTRFLSEVEPLHDNGADVVVPEEVETSVRIFTHVLGAYMIPPETIREQADALRAGDYQVFRSNLNEAHLMVLQGLDEDGLHTRAVAVRAGAPAAGKTLGELALRKEYQITVLAVRRQGRTQGNPDGDFRIEVDDRLVLVGEAQHFADSADLFRKKPAPSETSHDTFHIKTKGPV